MIIPRKLHAYLRIDISSQLKSLIELIYICRKPSREPDELSGIRLEFLHINDLGIGRMCRLKSELIQFLIVCIKGAAAISIFGGNVGLDGVG